MIYPGTVVAGKFRIVRLIGEGAMGLVYEAEHVQLGRRVALKILHERFAASARAVGRFEREARAAAAIGHDNIVDVIDFGHHEGIPYIVMEYLRGQTLAERLAAETTLDATEACRITGQVLSALASAHAVGIVHRDLKPGNVMLSERSAGRVIAKILDFGISKFASPDVSNRVATQAGMLLGTPSYMAPEQWLARTDIDHRADLYAVGVMLFEMLTGGLPYEGATRHELFVEVVRSTTPPPKPSEIAPGAPRALDAIALRAVQREQTDRFQTAAEFVEALRPYGAGDVVVTTEPAKIVDAEERSRSSNPPKRRAVHVTQKDDDRELIEAILRQRPGRSRLYIGAALLVTGVAISSGVLVTALRRSPVTTETPRPVPPVAGAMPRASTTPAVVVSSEHPEPSASATPAIATRSQPASGSSEEPSTRPRAAGRNGIAGNSSSTPSRAVQAASAGSNRASAPHAGANPTPMPVSEEF